MPNISYVYPNLSISYLKSTTPRGGFSERWALAKDTGCDFIELPGNLIKNMTEEKITSLEIGDFLSTKEISELYTQDEIIPDSLQYILHTDPSLSKKNRYGRKIQTPIKWYEKEWTKKHIEMIISISKYLQRPASVIEIHPGDKQNSYDDICWFIEHFIDAYHDEFNVKPLILLENRTNQFISKGKDIANYWNFLTTEYSHLEKLSGIVLDIQQLHTMTKPRFLEELGSVPNDCLKGFHIHSHRRNRHSHVHPMIGDEIPWRVVFGKIKQCTGDIFINPEIFEKNKVQQVIEFCEKLLT